MLKREYYLSKIRDFYYINSLIKILYGLKGSGKSVILQQIIEEIKESGIDDNHIIYINFESLDYANITNALELNNYVKSLVKDKKTYFVFLDEVQKVVEFEKAINSLRVTEQFSIFITGSNSKMTFLELSTDLSGRYVSFRINPLSFKEVVELTNTKKEKYFDLLLDIFEWGTLPQRFIFTSNDSKENYIRDVYDSILLKDVVDRLGITDVTSFNRILQYVLETETREFKAFNNINDNYPKYIISTNKEDYSQNGIKHINIFDFLMNDDF